jgi:UDP-glucose 4-epimerase
MTSYKRILLTGGSGFIGRNILEQLGSAYNITSPSHLELDLLNAGQVSSFLEKNFFDVVIHAAGAGVSRLSEQSDIYNLNKAMFLNLAENNNLFGRMIFLGSGAEYGKQLPIVNVKESDFGKVLPEDEYGKAKYFISEYIAKAKNIVSLRLFAVFGPHEDYKTRFISNNICRSLLHMPITLRQNLKFDFLDINDFVKILNYFINNEPAEKFYNITVGKPIEFLEVAEIIKKETQSTNEIQVLNPGLGKEYTGDNTKLLAEIREFTFTPLEQSVRDLVNYYRENLDSIKKEELNFNT